MDTNELKKVITKNIKANGRGEITGPVLQSVLVDMVNGLQSDGLGFLGIIEPGDPAPSTEKNGYYLSFSVNNPKYPEAKKWEGAKYFNGATLNRYCLFVWTLQDGKWEYRKVRYENHTRKVLVIGKVLPIKQLGNGDYEIHYDTNRIEGYIVRGALQFKKGVYCTAFNFRYDSTKVFSIAEGEEISNPIKATEISDFVKKHLRDFDFGDLNVPFASPFWKYKGTAFMWVPSINGCGNECVVTRKVIHRGYAPTDKMLKNRRISRLGHFDKKAKVKYVATNYTKEKNGWRFRYRRYTYANRDEMIKKYKGLSRTFQEYRPFVKSLFGKLETPFN